MRTKKSFFASARPIIIISIVCLFSSCATQNLFHRENTSSYASLDSLALQGSAQHTIRPDDKISVSIWNHDDLSIGSIFGIYNSNEVYGKWVLVDQAGYISLPKIGRVNVNGMTVTACEAKLRTAYAEYIREPIIVVKVLNREVTVLGEVKSPGVFLLEKEKNTLFETIGRAGGLDFYANKKEVKFIRNEKEYLLDLTKMEDFEQNNLVLQSGDIIYVPTRKGKTLDKKAPTLLPIASILTTVVVILTFINN